MAEKRASGAKSGTTYQPRREARVLRVEDLTEQQRHAGFEVHSLLRGYLERAHVKAKPAKGLRHFAPHISDSRWNQNLLLDGDRGSGKTSLLVTMLQLWSDLLGVERDVKDQEAEETDLAEKLKAWEIDKARWHVVPLSIVDLQPLPEHTPVLLHIAEPLVRVVEAIEEHDTSDDPSPAWLGGEPQGPKARKAWEELIRTIVAGWDDAASDRWRRLDPENAEFEINRAVRGHQALVSSFHTFVDQLIEDFKRWRGVKDHTPLFVLPVDDADMNPGRAEELLEALRMLHHPRLVFLLTGESGLFYRIAEERVARTLRSPRGRTQKEDDSPVRDSLATTLARRVYDKILPPSHRCALPLLGEDQRAKHLGRLSALAVTSHTHSKHLIPIGEILADPSVGAGLPGHLRVLNDLDLLIERHAASPSRALSNAVARVWAEAIEDAPTDVYLPSQLATRVRVDLGDRPLVIDALEGGPRMRDEGPWSLKAPERKHGDHPLTLQLRGNLRVRALAAKDNKEIPQQLLGALAFADMVAFEHGVPRGSDEPSQSEGLRPRFAQVLYRLSEATDPNLIGWPLPRGLNLLDRTLVNLRWRQLMLATKSLDDKAIDAAARWYLAVVAQLVTMYDTTFAPLPIAPSKACPVPAWDEVAKRVLHVAMLDGALTTREMALRDWAIGRATLLAAPESGLSAKSAQEFLGRIEAHAKGALATRIRESSRVQRNERLRASLKGDGNAVPGDSAVDELRKKIDDQDRAHPWLAFLSKKLATATAP